MVWRIWLTSEGDGHYRLTDQDPFMLDIRTVIVREPDEREAQRWPGVWVNAEPAYDVEILLDDIPTYLVPPKDDAVDACYEQHTSQGDGTALV